MQSIPLFAACKSADVYKMKNKGTPSHDLARFCSESTTTTFKAQRKRPANSCAPIWILHEPSGYDDAKTQLMAPPQRRPASQDKRKHAQGWWTSQVGLGPWRRCPSAGWWPCDADLGA